MEQKQPTKGIWNKVIIKHRGSQKSFPIPKRLGPTSPVHLQFQLIFPVTSTAANCGFSVDLHMKNHCLAWYTIYPTHHRSSIQMYHSPYRYIHFIDGVVETAGSAALYSYTRILETTVGHWFLSNIWIFQLSFAWWWIQVFSLAKKKLNPTLCSLQGQWHDWAVNGMFILIKKAMNFGHN